MNYLERLSSGDVKTICELIGPRELKQNFRANSNGFNTIKPGFRPNSLSDEMAVSLTAQNVTMRFISKFLNEKIQSMMDKIASEQDKLISQGVPSDGARVVALANSSFSNNMELYFRLEQPVRSSEEIGALKIAVRLVKGMCQNESNSVHASKAADNLEEDALRKELEAQKEYPYLPKRTQPESFSSRPHPWKARQPSRNVSSLESEHMDSASLEAWEHKTAGKWFSLLFLRSGLKFLPSTLFLNPVL